jgi:hypothetical protein
MIKSIKKFFWKRRYCRKLADDAFLKEAMAVYAETSIAEFQMLKHGKETGKFLIELEMRQLEDSIAGKKTTGSPLAFPSSGQEIYEQKKRLKELEKELEVIKSDEEAYANSIEQVKRRAETLRTEARELWSRRKTFMNLY